MSFKKSFLNQTAVIPATTFITAPASGLWHISLYMETIVIAGGASNLLVDVLYSDQGGAKDLNPAGNLDLTDITDVLSTSSIIFVIPGPITLSTRGTGPGYNGGTYNVYVVGEFIASFPA